LVLDPYKKRKYLVTMKTQMSKKAATMLSLRGRVDRRDAVLKRKDELGTAIEKMKTNKETIEELRTQLKKTKGKAPSAQQGRNV
jgi:hypothetical protein